MRTKTAAVLATGLLVATLALHVSATTEDPNTGTWKMNPTKSKYSPGPAPKNLTLKIDSDVEDIKLTEDGIDAAGKPIHIKYTAKYYGDPFPISGVPYADTIVLMRVDVYKTSSVLKKGDEIVMFVNAEVSKDGKTRTTTYHGKDERGREVDNTVVYDKQ
jgi:hypothetical protein